MHNLHTYMNSILTSLFNIIWKESMAENVCFIVVIRFITQTTYRQLIMATVNGNPFVDQFIWPHYSSSYELSSRYRTNKSIETGILHETHLHWDEMEATCLIEQLKKGEITLHVHWKDFGFLQSGVFLMKTRRTNPGERRTNAIW